MQENWVVDLNSGDEDYMYDGLDRISKEPVRVKIYPKKGPRIFALKKEVEILKSLRHKFIMKIL